MALTGHWPLNGNTNDISGNKLNASLINGPSYVDGKIGQAISLNGFSQYVNIPSKHYIKWYGQEFSVFLWVKISSADSDGSIISKPWNGNGQYNYRIYNRPDSIGVSLLGTQNYVAVSPAGSLVKDVWNHVGFTVNKTTLRIYINGVKLSETNHGITAWVPSSGDYDSENLAIGTLYPYTSSFNQPTHAVQGLFNDVRIYDHLLTDLEVQEVARAKILHYTFDDMQEPTTNYGRMLNTINIASSSIDSSWKIEKLDRDIVKVTALVNNPSTATYGDITGYIIGTRLIAAGKPVTLSCEVIDYRGSLSRIFPASGGFGTILNSGTFLGRHYMTITHTADWTHSMIIRAYDFANIVAGDYVTIKNTQMEEKAYPTEYTAGVRTGRVNDYSGFFNHSDLMTEENTPKWVPNAKIGMGAYLFNQNIISAFNNLTISTDYLTLAAWVKPMGTHTDDRGVVVESNGNYYLSLTPTQQLSVFWYDTTVQGYHTTTETLPLNQWSHIAAVWTGTQVILYINGNAVKVVNTLTPGRANGAKITIGRETTNRSFNGYIDDVRQYATALSATDIKNIYETRAEIEESGILYARDFLSNVAKTTNLITAPKNSLPTVGNAYGTQDTTHYNNNVAWSIGNIVSIVDNIVTVDGTGRTIYSYDCINPETTGGGVTANVDLFVKMHGTNQFSLHTYNASEDGSQGYIDPVSGGHHVHYSVDMDIRVPINSTDFPTMWHSSPHRPNQGLVKEIITNGFNYKGRVHDCLRLHRAFRKTDYTNAYMAYGVWPMVTAGKSYAFSFYVRAVNDIAVGHNIRLTMYTTGSWSGGTYGRTMILTKEWQRYEIYATAPASGITYLYFSNSTGVFTNYGDIEIAEIQCEEETKATEFTTTSRLASQLPDTIVFGANEINEMGIANFNDFSTVGVVDGLIGYWPFDGNTLDYSGNKYNAVEYSAGSSPIINSDNVEFQTGDGLTIPNILTYINKKPFTIIIMTEVTSHDGSPRLAMGYVPNVLEVNVRSTFAGITLRDSAGYKHADYYTSIPTGTPFLYTSTFDGSNLKYYHNGILRATISDHLNDVDFGTSLLLGNWTTLTQSYQGKLYYIKIYNRALTAEEIAIEYNIMFNKEVQIHTSGILYAKDVIQY